MAAPGRPIAIKLAASLLALALLVGLVLFFVQGGRDGTVRGSSAGVASAEAPVELVDDASLEEAESLPAEARSVAASVARSVVASEAPTSWRGELAGLTGRVVESDGKPVPGMRVSLIEVDSIYLFDGSAIEEEPPRFELEETVTDAEGRFLLGGARGPAFHGIGVDLGGPRATVRVIDHALPHRERTDIGDVVLAPFGVLTGRVVDGSGAPVAGARVRFGPFPEEILRASVQEFRADSLISVGQLAMGGGSPAVIDIPDWIRKSIDHFPVPTTQTAADGTFRLVGVALANVVGGIDKVGHVGVALGPFDLTGGERDIGQVVLTRGRTVRGVVEDAYGEPAAGVEVFAGAEIAPGIAAILQPCGATDEDGKFELSGVAETGQVVAAARRAKHEPWSITVTARHEHVLIEIQPTVQLTVKVQDLEGKPLAGAHIQVSPGRRPGKNRDIGDVFMILPKPVGPPDAFHEVEPGCYVNASLGAGLYDIVARVPGLAPAFLQTECLASENEVTLVCPVGRRVELTVIDAVTKAPIVGARGSILRASPAGFTKLSVQTTDQDGRALLGPLPDFSGEERISGFFPPEAMLLVQHPRYGDHSAQLEPSTAPLVVALQAGGTLAGKVHWAGAIPTRLYMLTLEYRGADGFLEVFHLPTFTVTDLAGEFRKTNLPPGKYRVELLERFLDQDPLGLAQKDFNAITLYQEELEIKNGETTELVIDLTPTGRGPLARVRGKVRLDGHNLEGAEVVVNANETVRLTTDSSGRFESQPFSVRGSARIIIEADVSLSDGKRRMQLHQETVELKNEDVHEIDLDLYPMPVRVQVVDATTGAPVPEAKVRVNKDDVEREAEDDARTNSAGEVTVMVLEPGDYTLRASAPNFGRGSSTVKVPAEGLTEVTAVRLPHSVRCAGRIQVESPEAVGQGNGFAYLRVENEKGGDSAGARLTAPDYAFSLDGLGPGKYSTWIYLGGRQGEQVTFELGPEGDQDLVLTFRVSQD